MYPTSGARHSIRRSGVAILIVASVFGSPVAHAQDTAKKAPATAHTEGTPDASLTAAVSAMKTSPKGPFESVRWFCADGSVLPPKAGACKERGGGVQHGVLSEKARMLRSQGFSIANVLASLDPAHFVGPEPSLGELRQLVLERFLIRWDDGWIFRGARSYRGALQIEDEEAASERILLALLDDPGWLEPSRYLLLRELARALPLPRQRDVAARMRTQAAELGDADPGFAPLRARIHSFPSPDDAHRVREYARTLTETTPDRTPYEQLAQTIDEFFESRRAALILPQLARRIGGKLGTTLANEVAALASKDAATRLAASARGLIAIREQFGAAPRPPARLAALRASLLLEDESFAASQAIIAGTPAALSRRLRIQQLRPLANALYGVGLLSARQLDALFTTIEDLTAGEDPSLGVWRSELNFIARVPEWSRRWLQLQFESEIDRLLRIEQEVELYAPDRLRGSPLLSFTVVLDILLQDAQAMSGATNHVLGQSVGVGLRGLNPGIARGILRRATTHEEVAALASDSVALLPETTSHLPPVAAILTLGEGSSLSHVQLLARNLGIPNAVLSHDLADTLRGHLGHEVEVVVSRGGLVQIGLVPPADPSARPAEPDRGLAIRVDPQRLDLDQTTLIPLDSISSDDSGRRCGPKAANLGELRKHFGETVPDGFVMPFGIFRELLNRPIEPGGPAAFDWLRTSYRELRALAASERPAAAARLLSRIREWLAVQEPGPELRAQIEVELTRLGGGGVFVRSDTNVEDLPGFSGAGLNLTVANVVGADAVLDAVRRVWASPFTDRAYAWRQAHMDRPELVFPSILVQHAFPSEKSGVMVTTDIDSGDPGILSVAVGEGVGGAVDGQAAESLRIERASGHSRQLSAATAEFVTELDPRGGTRIRRASGAESLLLPAEIEKLIELRDEIAELPTWAAAFRAGRAADVEFAFRGGQLALLQLRPLAESRSARTNERLKSVDAAWRASASRRVPLDDGPGSDPS